VAASIKGQQMRKASTVSAKRSLRSRKGAVVVLAALFMILMVGMLAFAIDVGYMYNSRAEAQRAADAAAYAGAGALGEGPAAAEDVARRFAKANSVGGRTVADGNIQIELGQWNTQTRQHVLSGQLATSVRAVVRQPSQPLFFGPLLGRSNFDTQAEAIATYSPRDIVVVLDYSASMNDDSELKHIDRIGRQQLEGNLLQIYEELGSPSLGSMQFTPVYISSDNTNTVKRRLGLSRVPYPYPSGSWDDYIRYVRTSDNVRRAGYRKRYGYLTLVNYWLERKPSHSETPALWKTSQQPITAVKDAFTVFLAYIQEVKIDDRVGLSIYTSPDGGGKLESELTRDFQKIEDISRQRQAGHYDRYTNIGAGLQKARLELEKNGRQGALKMIVLMTDGIANRPSNVSAAKAFVRREAQLAADSQFPVVTVSLGAAADKDLMQEVADATRGVHFNIPGGQSVSSYEEDLKDIFRQIADHRPLRLVK